MASHKAARIPSHPDAADELETGRATDTATQSRACGVNDGPVEVSRAARAVRGDETSVTVRRQRNRAGPIENRHGSKPIPNWYCEPEAKTTVRCGFWPEPDIPGLLRPRPSPENRIHERATPRVLSLCAERNQERQNN